MGKIDDYSINEWKMIKTQIDSLMNVLKSDMIKEPSLMILDNSDFKKIFKITDKTAQRWRDKNLVGYSKINGNIYYTIKDVMDLYQNYYHKPRSVINKILNSQ